MSIPDIDDGSSSWVGKRVMVELTGAESGGTRFIKGTLAEVGLVDFRLEDCYFHPGINLPDRVINRHSRSYVQMELMEEED